MGQVINFPARSHKEPEYLPWVRRGGFDVGAECGSALLRREAEKGNTIALELEAGGDIVAWPPHGDPTIVLPIGEAFHHVQEAGAAGDVDGSPCEALGSLVDGLTERHGGCSVLRLLTPLRPGSGRMRHCLAEVEIASHAAPEPAEEEKGSQQPVVWRRAVGFAVLV